ncbi:MAG: glycosyltransferase family 2 protein [Halobacteriota archaeon]|jgi:GT2 family glycosyltransferase
MPQLNVDRMDGVEWPKVFIIILNWNGWEDTIECLESLHTISYPNYNLIIVDNDSQDDSLTRIRAYARGEAPVESASRLDNGRIDPLHVTTYTRREAEDIQVATLSKKLAEESRNKASNASLVIIQNEQNFGYPEGNNIGMRYALKASADYVLLLNNDTVVDKQFLTELVRAADNDAGIGVIGPKICSYDAPNAIQSAGAHIDFWKGRAIGNAGKSDDELEHFAVDKLLPADFVSGSCFLIKRKVIEEVGTLDPTYFCYGEDLDWCVRISRAGYMIVCDLNTKIWHKSNVSTSKVRQCAEYYFHRNWVINARKHARVPQFISFLLLYPAYSIPGLLKARQFGHIRSLVRGFIDGLFTPITSQPALRR